MYIIYNEVLRVNGLMTQKYIYGSEVTVLTAHGYENQYAYAGALAGKYGFCQQHSGRGKNHPDSQIVYG